MVSQLCIYHKIRCYHSEYKAHETGTRRLHKERPLFLSHESESVGDISRALSVHTLQRLQNTDVHSVNFGSKRQNIPFVFTK